MRGYVELQYPIKFERVENDRDENFPYFCIMNNVFQTVIQVLLEALPSLKAVYLFGSRAAGTERPESDYDFAFLAPGHTLSDYEIHQLRLLVSNLLDADVDLVDLQQASTVLQFQIVAKGQRIFSSDNLYCDEFDLFVFSSYQHLNEGQQAIIQDIKQRGKVYA